MKMIDNFIFRGHVCATFEVLGQNLYQVLKNGQFSGLPLKNVKIISRQVLHALKFTHSHGYVHCDLKPENILLVPPSLAKVKLADFGSACKIGQTHFDYIQSRFYRAPEVILGLKYGPAIDIWSFGCLVAELVTGRPIFPGESENHQFFLQMEALGVPHCPKFAKAPRRSVFFPTDGVPKGGMPKKKSIERVTGIHNADVLELLERCFEWDPEARITAAEALALPFFESKAGSEILGAKPSARLPVSRGLSPRWAPRSLKI
jgi:dual specificity tyrosine-phosphorylation-regulated kinase 2/3/4